MRTSKPPEVKSVSKSAFMPGHTFQSSIPKWGSLYEEPLSTRNVEAQASGPILCGPIAGGHVSYMPYLHSPPDHPTLNPKP